MNLLVLLQKKEKTYSRIHMVIEFLQTAYALEL